MTKFPKRGISVQRFGKHNDSGKEFSCCFY